jgi:hypothetical protein
MFEFKFSNLIIHFYINSLSAPGCRSFGFAE